MKHTLTEENIQKLKEELEYRMTVKRAEIAKDKLEAAAHGDRSENAEYKEACERYNNNDNRIQQIHTIIANAVIVKETPDDKTALGINSKAKIKFIDFEEEDTVTLVTTMDVDVANMHISVESDLGKALLGKKVGEIAEVNAPSGKYNVQVLEIL